MIQSLPEIKGVNKTLLDLNRLKLNFQVITSAGNPAMD